ncbi:Potassium Channel Subfamily T Member 2 [Manis pentadactyla]|nr:Potassium Channel Subfamily T Member 2 [Manis pentadactyla]
MERIWVHPSFPVVGPASLNSGPSYAFPGSSSWYSGGSTPSDGEEWTATFWLTFSSPFTITWMEHLLQKAWLLSAAGAGQAAGAAAPEPQREEAPAGRRRPAARQVLLETYIWHLCEIQVENHMYEYCCQAVDSLIMPAEGSSVLVADCQQM